MPASFNIDSLSLGESVTIRTRNTAYVVRAELDRLTIQGHPRYCPTPRQLIPQSYPTTFVGDYWEFATVEHPKPIGTSRVMEILL